MSSSAPFKVTASSFVPKGVNIVTEEEFPDLANAFSGKPVKKTGPTPAELKKKQEEEYAALPTKGKPSSFFCWYFDPEQKPNMSFDLE